MSEMTRVSKKRPCPVCQKADWCLLGRSMAICMRVQSQREKTFSDGSVGWMHRIDGGPFPIEPPKPKANKPAPNLNAMMEKWFRFTKPEAREKLAQTLGVTTKSLELIGAALRDDHTWAFPMRDARNYVVGIRIRSDLGRKWAIEGSHQGLFIPQIEPEPLVFLPEGPTNTAAVLSLGRFAVGRPSSNGAVLTAAEAVKNMKCRKAVIVADTDPDRVWDKTGKDFNPGADGAALLASKLGIPSCTLLLPCKDMRDFVRNGGDAATLDYLVNQCVWRNP